MLCKQDGLRLTIRACYWWEIASNIGLDASFDNMYEWKGIREKARKVHSTETYKMMGFLV